MEAPMIDDELEEITDVGSFNHATIQANLAYVFKKTGNFTVTSDLSLDLGDLDLSKFDLRLRKEIKPDICVYPKRKLNPGRDILRMSEMPLLAIEILSPRQGLYEIMEKFKVYFELGIKTCWLVIPSTETVTVYTTLDTFHNCLHYSRYIPYVYGGQCT